MIAKAGETRGSRTALFSAHILHFPPFLSCFPLFLVSPVLAGKTHKDHFVTCFLSVDVVCRCLLMLSFVVVCCEKGLTFGSVFHMLRWISTKVTWVIDATWEHSFVDEVTGHLRSSC